MIGTCEICGTENIPLYEAKDNDRCFACRRCFEEIEGFEPGNNADMARYYRDRPTIITDKGDHVGYLPEEWYFLKGRGTDILRSRIEEPPNLECDDSGPKLTWSNRYEDNENSFDMETGDYFVHRDGELAVPMICYNIVRRYVCTARFRPFLIKELRNWLPKYAVITDDYLNRERAEILRYRFRHLLKECPHIESFRELLMDIADKVENGSDDVHKYHRDDE